MSEGENEDILKSLCAENLPDFDEGQFAIEFNDAVSEILEHISKYPYRRDGEKIKTEPRKITVEFTLEPIAKAVEKRIETENGTRKQTVVELTGLTTACKVFPSKPRYQSGRVNMVTKIRNGKIITAEFNPHNSEQPDQLELNYDD